MKLRDIKIGQQVVVDGEIFKVIDIWQHGELVIENKRGRRKFTSVQAAKPLLRNLRG